MSSWYEHYLVPEDPTFKPAPGQMARLVWGLYDGGFIPRTVVGPPLGAPPEGESRDRTARDVRCLAHTGPGSYRPFPCPCSVEDVVALGGRDYRLIWSVEDADASGLEYPLGEPPFEEMPYELEIHSAKDYVYHTSSIIDPFDRAPVCRCGELLEYDDPWESDEDLTARGAVDLPFPRLVFGDRRIHRTCPVCGAAFRPQDYVVVLRDGRTGETLGPRTGGATYLFAIFIECYKCWNRDRPDRASDEFLDLCQKAIGASLFEIGDWSGC